MAFGRLFGARRKADPADPPARAPEGEILYAIGDVHGRVELLQKMLSAITADWQTRPGAAGRIILLGDYIDRGRRSKETVELVIQLMTSGARVHALKGNHEATAVQFLSDAAVGPSWSEYGGSETLRSYGVAPPRLRHDLKAWEGARHAFAEALPAEHLRFFERLELAVQLGDYLFVHAGVQPGVDWRDQGEEDLLWIRDSFLNHPRPSELCVVHGHTPAAEPYLGRNRIGLDTGAYATGVLSAVRLEGEDQRIIQVR